MPFFDYRQNNSGGSFMIDHKVGISNYVVIEAEDAEAADSRAELLGLYFNGCASGMDCDCCGDRWYPQHDRWGNDEGGNAVPSIYGESVEGGKWYTSTISWNDPSGYIHYTDGRVVPVVGVKVPYGWRPGDVIEGEIVQGELER